MYRRNKVSYVRPPSWLDWFVAGAAVLILLLLPLAATAGLSTAAAPETSGAAPADREAKAAPGVYQIRCWQYGRLLFEENRVSLQPESSPYGIKLAGTDRNHRPLYVADTKNATCLIRSAVDERAAWPR